MQYNSNDSRRKRNNKARERYQKRKDRREAMVTARDESVSKLTEIAPKGVPNSVHIVWDVVRDTVWHLVYRTSALKIGGALIAIIAVLFTLRLVLSDDIKPFVSSMSVPLGGLSIEEAEAALLQEWNDTVEIRVMLGDATYETVRPSVIGLRLDAFATAEAAKEAGFSGIPFGTTVEPIIIGDYGTAQTYLLNVNDEVYIPPYEAHYTWDEASQRVVGVEGTPSRELDIAASAQHISEESSRVVRSERFELVTFATAPQVVDPSPYLLDAQAFIDSQFTISGYDPFTNDSERWRTTPDEMARWLVAGTNGLRIDARDMERFVEGVNIILGNSEKPRYIDENEVARKIETALNTKASEVATRIRYRQREYTVSFGDTGFGIGASEGLPFRLINEQNPNIEWNSLSNGDTIVLPSRDAVLPMEPIATKRIVVDLDRRWLVAYEDGQEVFNWAISIGRPNAPTSPGIFQILDKNEKAGGSSFALCTNNGCGQWVMDYFMSIYEVAPGLTNGFHGAVLLPNGSYLDGGSNQTASTFGCVMSDNQQALMLFEWAEVGTIVEIVSYRQGFEPESDIGRDAMELIGVLSGQSVQIPATYGMVTG